MTTDDTTPQHHSRQNQVHQGEGQTSPLFCIEPGIPCQHAREQASELMGCVRDLTIAGIMEAKPQLLWASY